MTTDRERKRQKREMMANALSGSVFRALPEYPFLPCPICGFNGSCDHTVRERASAKYPALQLDLTHDH